MRDSLALGSELKSIRKQRGLTQAQVAAAAGVARSSVIDLEHGKPTTELRTALAVAAALRQDLLPISNLRPSEALAAHSEEIRRLAGQFGIQDLRVFGSTARKADTPMSDIDLIAHIPGNQHPGDTEHFREQVAVLTGFDVDLISDELQGAKYDAIRATAVPL